MMRKIFAYTILLLFSLPYQVQANSPDVILLIEPGRRAVENYYLTLLDLAISSGGKDDFVYSIEWYSPGKKLKEEIVASSEKPLIMVAGTSPALERDLLPVRVPIYLGIGSGYRLMLINNVIQEDLKSVKDLNGLRAYKVGQGRGWNDVPILERAGLTVIKAPEYAQLFPMVVQQQFDLFSRGLFEAYPEYEAYKHEYPELAVDEHLLIVYPFAIYFFVSKKFPELHAVIESGLKKAYENGSLKKLLLRQPYISNTLGRANLEDRVRIDLPPYGLTPETEAAIKKYTFE